jgi:biotin transport system substrate-specific component
VYARVKTFENISPVVRDLTLTTLFAALTALGAQIAVRLPFSPVPITLQVLMVIGAGLVLGSRRGPASQLLYLTVGVVGLPVFAGGTGGPAVLLGPTGGYLVAFPAAAFAAGWLAEKSEAASWLGWLIASLAALAVIYSSGASWLAVWLWVTGASSLPTALNGAWRLGVAPFFLADLAKAILVVLTLRGARTLLTTWFEASALDHIAE